MSKRKKNGGFTLVELLVGIAILFFIMAGIAEALSSGYLSSLYNMSNTNSKGKARETVIAIEDNIRYSVVSITSPALGASGNELDYADSAGNTYKIYVPSTGSNANTVVILKNGTTVVASKAMGLIKPADLVFTRDASDKSMLTIGITLNDLTYQGSPTVTVTSRIKLMNM